MPTYKWRGYDIVVSTRPDKKYMTVVDGKRIHFGARGMAQYKDQLGYYAKDDHEDEDRRDAYRARHGAIPGKPHLVEGTPAFFSWNLLW